MSRRRRRERLSPKKSLKIFLDCVEELKARPFILKGLYDFQFRIDFQKETGEILCEINEADQEDLRSFLMAFRKFILNDEPANIDSILNTCLEFVRSDQTELKEVLKQFKTTWKYQYRTGTIQMTSAKLKLTPEYVLDLWLNGDYFHNGDPQKTEQLRTLLRRDVPSVKLQLLWSLPILTTTIILIGGLLNKALSDGALGFPEDA
ncbi:MAG: hypothetical protein ACUZ77_08715 [Candidatus Brocadiales bacterium]